MQVLCHTVYEKNVHILVILYFSDFIRHLRSKISYLLLFFKKSGMMIMESSSYVAF